MTHILIQTECRYFQLFTFFMPIIGFLPDNRKKKPRIRINSYDSRWLEDKKYRGSRRSPARRRTAVPSNFLEAVAKLITFWGFSIVISQYCPRRRCRRLHDSFQHHAEVSDIVYHDSRVSLICLYNSTFASEVMALPWGKGTLKKTESDPSSSLPKLPYSTSSLPRKCLTKLLITLL